MEREEERTREEKMERSWVMDALCVSVIPNYWTLPFKASLRCISHFFLSDWWRAGYDWGHCVLNSASRVIQYLLQIQYTAGAATSPGRLRCIFRHLYSFSCSVIKCIVSLRSGLLCVMQKNKKQKTTWDYISCLFKEVFKATKIHCRERSLKGEAALWYWAKQIHAIPTVAASLKCIQPLSSLSPSHWLIPNIFKGC